MQVKEEKGNYTCLKHNQMILFVVMDNSTLLENMMLCNMCISQNKSQLNQALSVEQAQAMIKEKLAQQTAGQEKIITKQLQQLRNLSSNMISIRQQFLINIDTIIRMFEQWANDLTNSIKKNQPTDLINGLQLLQQHQGQNQNLIEQYNKTYTMEIFSVFQRLLNIDAILECYSDLHRIVINDEQNQQQIRKIEKFNEKQQVINNQLGKISYQMISQVKQEEYSNAIAFNNIGSIMVSGSKEDIKVWKFENGNIILLNLLKGQVFISCLLFSKKNQQFISGDDGGIIKCWKQGNNNSEWLCNQAENKHTDTIRCIILTKNEDQLISCSDDQTIIVWSVKYQLNQLEYQYSLENKHTDSIGGLSLNQSETALVSCSADKRLILWINGQNHKWIYQHSVSMPYYLSRVCFIGENQVLIQQDGREFTNVFEVQNQELKEQQNLQIKLNDPFDDYDNIQFPTIYNENKQIIIQKSHQYVYIIRKQGNGSFKVEAEPIDCETSGNYGTLTEDGDYLVIWNDKTTEFRVYKISYE